MIYDATPWVIVGCGYVGHALAARLRHAEHPVIVTARTVEGVRQRALSLWVGARQVDVSNPRMLEGWIPENAIVVDSVPPDPKHPHEDALVVAAAASGANRIVYLGATGVYPRGDGTAWVDEDSPTGPVGELGKARLKAEEAFLAAADREDIEAVVLRIAAIYGPERGVAARLRAGSYRIPGDGSTVTSRIHVHDLVSAIIAAGTVEPLTRPVYVVGDDEPCTVREHAEGIAGLLGLPAPASVPLDELTPEARELVSSNRRIRNARMKSELGVKLKYPTWREGARGPA